MGGEDAGRVAAAAALARQKAMSHDVGLAALGDERDLLGRDYGRVAVVGYVEVLFPREDLDPDFEQKAIPVIARRRQAYLDEMQASSAGNLGNPGNSEQPSTMQ